MGGIFSFPSSAVAACPPKDRTEADRYYAIEFVPKYKREQCIVRMEYEDLGPIGSHSDIDWLSDVKCYLLDHEPKASVFILGRVGGSFPRYSRFIVFADQCDRRFEIADGIAVHLNREFYGDFRVTASREPVSPDPDDDNLRGFWIDDPKYDPEFWALRLKANRGDGESLFRLAETNESRNNPKGTYIMYMRAADCLPSGLLRTKALDRARAVHIAMQPEDQKRVGPLLENFRNDALRFGVSCRR